MSSQKISTPLTGKNVVILGSLGGHIQRFTDKNQPVLGFQLCKAIGSDTDIVVVT